MKELIKKKLPLLNDLELIDEIEKIGDLNYLSVGDSLIKKGSYPKFIPLILDGIIKVNRIDDEGHEIFLYYLSAGQSCSIHWLVAPLILQANYRQLLKRKQPS